ncbi:hypothetical protein, partial [Bacillus sonorensis]|uniref:hypothetical protein n=1 Tax=Bacillus sonorensis TaxID=119858 RepID=UPI0022E70696
FYVLCKPGPVNFRSDDWRPMRASKCGPGLERIYRRVFLLKILVVKYNGLITSDEQREKIREEARKAIERGVFVCDEMVSVDSVDVEANSAGLHKNVNNAEVHLKSTELNDPTQKTITVKSPSVYTEAIKNITKSFQECVADIKQIIYEKPPIGVKPRFIHDEQRAEELSNAMMRYIQVNRKIPAEWLEEYNELVGNEN